jgi:hypothetical protein
MRPALLAIRRLGEFNLLQLIINTLIQGSSSDEKKARGGVAVLPGRANRTRDTRKIIGSS